MAGTLPGGQYRGKVVLQNAVTAVANGETLYCLQGSSGAFTAVVFGVEGISGDTITFEGTVDGTNWYGLLATNLTTGAEATTATADGIYRATVLGLTAVRARYSTDGGGTITVLANLVA